MRSFRTEIGGERAILKDSPPAPALHRSAATTGWVLAQVGLFNLVARERQLGYKSFPARCTSGSWKDRDFR